MRLRKIAKMKKKQKPRKRHFVELPADLHAMLANLARANDRKINAELRVLITAAFRSAGIIGKPPDAPNHPTKPAAS